MSMTIRKQSHALRCEVCHAEPPVDDTVDRCAGCADIDRIKTLQKFLALKKEVLGGLQAQHDSELREEIFSTLEHRTKIPKNKLKAAIRSDKELYEIAESESRSISLMRCIWLPLLIFSGMSCSALIIFIASSDPDRIPISIMLAICGFLLSIITAYGITQIRHSVFDQKLRLNRFIKRYEEVKATKEV